MIETISFILFLLAVIFVALGPKRSDKKDDGRDTRDSSGPDRP